MKIAKIYMIIFIISLLTLSGCIYDFAEEERPKTVKIKGKILVDMDGIGIGQPPVPITDIEEYFVIYSRMDDEQSIDSEIDDIEYVKDFEAESGKSRLPLGVQIFTDDEADEIYSEDGEFEIEVLMGTSTVWAGVPGKGYDVGFIDVEGLLEYGQVLDEIDDDDIEIIITPRESGKAIVWVGPDDENKLGKLAHRFDEYYIRGAAVGVAGLDSPGKLMNKWESKEYWHNNGKIDSKYWWYVVENTPGKHNVAFNFGKDPDGGYAYGNRGDILSKRGEIGGAEILNEIELIGKSSSEKYSPTISNIELIDAEHIVKKSGAEFRLKVNVAAKYIKGGIKSVKVDLSSLGFAEELELEKVEGFLYESSVLNLPRTLLAGDYEIKIIAEDMAGTKSDLYKEIKVTSMPVFNEDSLVFTPQTALTGDIASINISVEVKDEVGEGINYVKAYMPNGDVVDLFDNGFRADKVAGDKIYTLPVAYSALFYETGVYEVKLKAQNRFSEETSLTYDFELYSRESKMELIFTANVSGELTAKVDDINGNRMKEFVMENTGDGYSSGVVDIAVGDYRYSYHDDNGELMSGLVINKKDLSNVLSNDDLDYFVYEEESLAVNTLTINFINGAEGTWELTGEIETRDVVFDADGKAQIVLTKLEIDTADYTTWTRPDQLDLKFQTMDVAVNTDMGAHGVDITKGKFGVVTIDLSIEDHLVSVE